MIVHLLEAEYIEYGTGLVKTLYVSTGGYTTSPTDNPPNQHYDALIVTPLVFERGVLEDGVTGGIGSGGYGICELNNINGEFDSYRRHGFDGRKLRWLYGNDTDPYSSFTERLVGTMTTPEFTESIFGLKVRDNTELLKKKLQSNLYTGGNVLPLGIEGVAGDLKDKTKPLCFGKVYNIEPPLVNTSKVVYQVHDGKIQAIHGVYSNGAALTFYQNFTDNASLLAATIPAGNYATCLNEGLFRLNNNGATVITADVSGDATDAYGGYVSTPGTIVKRILKRSAGFTDSNFNETSFTTLEAKCSYETGIYFQAGETPIISDAIDDLIRGLRIWGTFEISGKFVIGRYDGITGAETPIVDLTLSEIIFDDFSVVPSFSFGEGNVPYLVDLAYQFNHRVLSKTEVAGIISTDAARAAWLSVDWRHSKVEDASVKTLHALATVFEYETRINLKTAADAEAAAVLLLYKSPIDRFSFKVKPSFVKDVTIGSIIKVTLPRLELSNGKNFMVINIKEDYVDDMITLEVMGNGI